MRYLTVMAVTSALLSTAALQAKSKPHVESYDVVDARYLPYHADLDSTVRGLPKALKPATGMAHRCVVLELDVRIPDQAFVPLYFDRFSLAVGASGDRMTIPAVGVGVGPLPLRSGDPQDKWTDEWEMGQARGGFSLVSIGGGGGKTSKVKLMFLVPQDVADVTLMQKSAAGQSAIVKAGIRIQ
jgi:hypothetical protein